MDLQPRPTATAAPAPSATTTQTGAEDRSAAFRPVQGGNELQSGEKLLVEAYAAIWLILFALVLFSWRRQKALDERVAALEGAIAAKKRGEE